MNPVLQRIATTCAATALALAAAPALAQSVSYDIVPASSTLALRIGGATAPATTQLAGTLLGQRSGATLAFSGGSTLGASGSGSGVASGTVAFVPFSVNFSVTAIGGAILDGVTAQRLLPGWPVALTSAGGVETFAARVLTAPYSVALTGLVVDVSADGLAGVLVPILQPDFEGLLAAQLGSLAAPAFDGTMLATRNVWAVREPGSAPLLALGLAALGLAGRRRLAGLARVRAVGRCACPTPRLPLGKGGTTLTPRDVGRPTPTRTPTACWVRRQWRVQRRPGRRGTAAGELKIILLHPGLDPQPPPRGRARTRARLTLPVPRRLGEAGPGDPGRVLQAATQGLPPCGEPAMRSP